MVWCGKFARTSISRSPEKPKQRRQRTVKTVPGLNTGLLNHRTTSFPSHAPPPILHRRVVRLHHVEQSLLHRPDHYCALARWSIDHSRRHQGRAVYLYVVLESAERGAGSLEPNQNRGAEPRLGEIGRLGDQLIPRLGEIGRLGDQLIPRLGEPKTQPQIGRHGDQMALSQSLKSDKLKFGRERSLTKPIRRLAGKSWPYALVR